MRGRYLLACAAALLTGCGDSQPTQPKQPIVVRSEAQDQLHQLDDMNRAIALKRAIYASGFRCKRVPKAQRQVNPDGSWREEVRQGKCITIKEKSPTGEYKETRRCN